MAVKPLSSYPKEFFDVWKLAVAGKLSIEFPKRATAINLRTRLYAYRKRLDEQSPQLAAPLKAVDLIVEPKEPGSNPDAPHILKGAILPWKAQVRELAKDLPDNAIPSPGGIALPLSATTPEEIKHVLPDAMDSTLQNLGFGTGDKE